MIKFSVILIVSFAVYAFLGMFIPILGNTAIIFPLLRGLPGVGAFLGFLTYKGVLAMACFSALSARL